MINADFHAHLYAPAPLQTSDRYTRLQLSRPEAMERAQREYAELIAPARKGEVERACKRLALHIETVRKVLARKG